MKNVSLVILATLLVISRVERTSGGRVCKAMRRPCCISARPIEAELIPTCAAPPTDTIPLNSSALRSLTLDSRVHKARGTTTEPLALAIAFVYSTNGPKTTLNGKRFTLTFNDGALEPALAIVSEGTVIRFRSRDEEGHNPSYYGIIPFGRSIRPSLDDDRLEPSFYPPLKRDAVKSLGVICDIHPKERAQVWVVPAQQFAISNADGRFDDRLDVPSESATIIIARPGYKSQYHPISICEGELRFRNDVVLEKESLTQPQGGSGS